MKNLLSIVAVCLCVTLVGCESTDEAESSSMGAVGTCGVDCEEACCESAAPGAVSESDCGACPSEGATCPATGASMGAVSESSCGSKASDCGAASTCSGDKG